MKTKHKALTAIVMTMITALSFSGFSMKTGSAHTSLNKQRAASGRSMKSPFHIGFSDSMRDRNWLFSNWLAGGFWGWQTGATISPGLLDDGKVYLPANYTNWAPPARGGSYTDPAYGTIITRLSNGLVQFNDAVHHEYSTMSPFNKDNTKLLLLTDRDGFIVTDIRGNVIVPPDRDGLLNLGGLSDPRWSATDPNIFYYHRYNAIRKFDVTTRQYTVLKTFTQFESITFGDGESDVSEDGNYLVVIGDQRYVGVYNISTNMLGPTLDLQGLGTFDYFDMTANSNVIARWTAQGSGRYKGFELFDKNLNFIRQVFPYGAHADRGRDVNGDEVLIILAATDLAPAPGCEANGIEKVRLSDGRKTCLMALNWDVGVHISANSNGSNPWVLVSTVDERLGTAVPSNRLVSDWQTRWKSYYNELFLVKMDGSEVRRIAHHRSRNYDRYWFYPRAAISRDGAYAIFDSNFDTNPIYEYSDAFLVSLKTNAVTNVSAASYAGATLAQESIAAAFGTDLAATSLLAPAIPLPTSLGGTQVLLRDSTGAERAAPLFFVSPTQINYQIPPGTAPGAANVSIVGGNIKTSAGAIQIASVSPGLFTVSASGQGIAVGNLLRIKADGTQSYEPISRFDPSQNRFVSIPIDLGPATDQVFLVLYGTGIRKRSALSAVNVDIGGVNAEPLFAGAQENFIGLDQVNVRLPRSLAGRGDVDITLKADNQPANKARVNIK